MLKTLREEQICCSESFFEEMNALFKLPRIETENEKIQEVKI